MELKGTLTIVSPIAHELPGGRKKTVDVVERVVIDKGETKVDCDALTDSQKKYLAGLLDAEIVSTPELLAEKAKAEADEEAKTKSALDAKAKAKAEAAAKAKADAKPKLEPTKPAA